MTPERYTTCRQLHAVSSLPQLLAAITLRICLVNLVTFLASQLSHLYEFLGLLSFLSFSMSLFSLLEGVLQGGYAVQSKSTILVLCVCVWGGVRVFMLTCVREGTCGGLRLSSGVFLSPSAP